ncbi:MAG: dihydrodipicolinate synthase family protein [Candidatus Bathyarchaeia archaeon]
MAYSKSQTLPSELEDLKNRFRGVFAFLITPFEKRDWMKLDEEGLRKNVRFLLENGVKNLVPCGGTGELFSLTPEEHKRIVEIVASEAPNKAIVAPGVPGNTKLAIELARHAEKVGCQAVLAFPPSGSEEGIFLHYRALAESLKIGLWVYNTLGWRPEFTARLASLERVIAVKDETGDLKGLIRTKRLLGERLRLICGVDHVTRDTHIWFMEGMDGYTCGLINFVPKLELGVYEASLSNDWETMHEIQRRLEPLQRLRGEAGSISMVKEANEMLGLAGGAHRPPQLPLTEAQRERLRKLLEELGLKPRIP